MQWAPKPDNVWELPSARDARGAGPERRICDRPLKRMVGLPLPRSMTADCDHSTPPDESAYDRFQLHDARAIVALLERMIEQRCTVTVAPAHEPAATGTVTVLLAVDRGRLWLDVPRTGDLLKRLLGCHQLSFDASFERVQVRFGSGPALLDQFDGAAALSVPVPVRILHLQRRELMRRNAPAGAVRCLLPSPTLADPEARLDVPVRDIGGGGLALLVPGGAIALSVGDVLRRARIEAPDLGSIEVDLEVRHLRETRQRIAIVRQVGCTFLDLSPAAQSRLFRYLMQLDRALLARR